MPDEIFIGNIRTEVASLGAHVSVQEFEPCSGECVSKDFGVLVEMLGDLSVRRVTDHGHVSGGHHGWNFDGRVFCVRSHVDFFLVRWCPLVCSCRALFEGPRVFVLEEHVKVAVVPLDGVRRPSAFDAAGDGVATDA